MYAINTKKFQNMEDRGPDGRIPVGAKRRRLPQSCFENGSVEGRSGSLHPTKGWRSRNLEWQARHGETEQTLFRLREQARHRWLIEREERKKQKAKRDNH
jgi:hypothetical protein